MPRNFIVPAAVLAEGILTGSVGHDFHVRRLLTLAHVVEVDSELGYAAGVLRQEAVHAGFDPPPSGADAIVAAEADDRARGDDVKITSDGDDFELLASLVTHAGRLAVVVV